LIEVTSRQVEPLRTAFSDQFVMFSSFWTDEVRTRNHLQMVSGLAGELFFSYSIRMTRYLFLILLDYCRYHSDYRFVKSPMLFVVLFGEVFKVYPTLSVKQVRVDASCFIFSAESSVKCPGDTHSFHRLLRGVIQANPEEIVNLLRPALADPSLSEVRLSDLFFLCPRYLQFVNEASVAEIEFQQSIALPPNYIGFLPVIASKFADEVVTVDSWNSANEPVFCSKPNVTLRITSDHKPVGLFKFGILPVASRLDDQFIFSPFGRLHFRSTFMSIGITSAHDSLIQRFLKQVVFPLIAETPNDANLLANRLPPGLFSFIFGNMQWDLEDFTPRILGALNSALSRLLD
jgi:hypothetical protein